MCSAVGLEGFSLTRYNVHDVLQFNKYTMQSTIGDMEISSCYVYWPSFIITMTVISMLLSLSTHHEGIASGRNGQFCAPTKLVYGLVLYGTRTFAIAGIMKPLSTDLYM